MEKLKEFWNKLKYWQRGGIIGLVFAIAIQIYAFIIYKSYSGAFAIINGIPLIIAVFIDKSTYLADSIPFSTTTILLITIWNTGVGMFLGKLYDYLKSKYSKSTKFNVFILILLILLYIVIVLVIFFYIYIFVLIPET